MRLHATFDPAVGLALLVLLLTPASVLASQQDSRASAVVAPQGSSAASGSSSAAEAEPTKIICRQTPPIGTRIPKKTCKTAAQWEEIRRMGSDAAREGAEKGRICGENCGTSGS